MKKDKYIAGIDPVYDTGYSLSSSRFVIMDSQEDPPVIKAYCKSCSRLLPLKEIHEESSSCPSCINRAIAIMGVMDNLKLVE